MGVLGINHLAFRTPDPDLLRRFYLELTGAEEVEGELRERAGAIEAASLISLWFGDSTELHLLDSHSEEVGDRVHVSYRFEGVEEGEPYLVEQQLYCTVADGKVTRADLLCSGFRPRHSP